MIKKIKTLVMITFVALSFTFTQTANAIEFCCKDEACFLKKWDALFKTGFCSGLGTFDDSIKKGCKDFCDEVKANWSLKAASVKTCVAAIQHEKTDPKVQKIAAGVFEVALRGLCTYDFPSCGSCKKSDKVKDICGYIGCNYPSGQSMIGGCAKAFSPANSCAAYGG